MADARAATPVFDVLCVGLVCVDLTLSVPHHPGSDEKLRATSRLITPGGPAAVAAAQIARLGGRAAFAGLIGDPAHDPFAALLRQELESADIDTHHLHLAPGHPTPLAAILVKPDATRAVVSHRPPPNFVTNLVTNSPNSLSPNTSNSQPFVTKLVTFPSAQVVLADGHRPEWTPALIAHARACRAALVLDAGSWTDAVRDLATAADHLIASEACARAALGPGEDPAVVSPARLRAALGARHDATVVVTLGPRGLVWSVPGSAGASAAFRIDAVDTTGAGDAFHGAYALALARGHALDHRLRPASAAGALACTRQGAWSALADATAISNLLSRTSRHSISPVQTPESGSQNGGRHRTRIRGIISGLRS